MTADDEFKQQTIAELRAGDKRMDAMASELTELRLAYAQLNAGLLANSAAVQRVEGNTGEMLAVFQSWKGAMQALDAIGKVARPVTYIIALCTAVAGALAVWKTK